jgi:outer membrane receptor protein involved in Fe transport
VQPAFGTFDSHTVLNLKAGYEAERFSVLFFANNVFDKRYFTLVTNTYALNGPTDLYLLGSVGRPREVGLRATFNF